MPKPLSTEERLQGFEDILDIVSMAKELAVQLEADKNRERTELLEVRLLLAIESIEERGKELREKSRRRRCGCG